MVTYTMVTEGYGYRHRPSAIRFGWRETNHAVDCSDEARLSVCQRVHHVSDKARLSVCQRVHHVSDKARLSVCQRVLHVSDKARLSVCQRVLQVDALV